MFKKLFKEEQGFTMIELIIVIAIIGIIGAIVAPQFSKTTNKAKFNADIQSVRTLNDSKALYEAERGSMTETKVDDIIDKLIAEDYLQDGAAKVPQLQGACFDIDGDEFRLNINGISDKDIYDSSDATKGAYGSLSDAYKELIDTGTATTNAGSKRS